MAKKGELTPKQKLFVQEYVIDSNASRAALAAGYSPRTAAVIGHLNLKKLNIMQAITKIVDAKHEKTEITAEFILSSLKLNAMQCLRIQTETGKPVDAGAANKALELLGKTKKMFIDKMEVDAMVGAYERNLKELD